METEKASWFIVNANWLVPLIITALFSILNIILVVMNLKMVKSQVKLQNDVFCYQLFERRMGVYTSIQKALVKVMQEAAVSVQLISEFSRSTRDASFLFGDDVSEKIDLIYKLIIELSTVSSKISYNIQMQNTASNHEKLCDRESELLKEISEIEQHLNETFEPYISFKDYRIKSAEVKL